MNSSYNSATETITRNRRAALRQSQRGTEESPVMKWTLVSIALAFCLVFLLLGAINLLEQWSNRFQH